MSSPISGNSYIVGMGIASALMLLKIYLSSYFLSALEFSSLVTSYYIANVLVVLLPIGSLLYMHSQLPADVASIAGMKEKREVGQFISSALLVSTVFGIAVILIAMFMFGIGAVSAGALFGWAYAVSQVAIVAMKVSRNYNQFSTWLAIRAMVSLLAVLVAIAIDLQPVEIIIVDALVVLLVGAVGLHRWPLTFRISETWFSKVKGLVLPSGISAVFGNADRLLAAALLADDDLARFGVMYLAVGAFGTLIQFANTKFLPELFVEKAKMRRGDNPLKVTFRKFRKSRTNILLVSILAIALSSVVCVLLALASQYTYSVGEVTLVAMASIARSAEVLGSLGMATLGFSAVAFIQVLSIAGVSIAMVGMSMFGGVTFAASMAATVSIFVLYAVGIISIGRKKIIEVPRH